MTYWPDFCGVNLCQPKVTTALIQVNVLLTTAQLHTNPAEGREERMGRVGKTRAEL